MTVNTVLIANRDGIAVCIIRAYQPSHVGFGSMRGMRFNL
jgi:acetyl/propionyl-CoA carboxylase alpha subunit